MLDIKLIRENPGIVKDCLLKRGENIALLENIIRLDSQRLQVLKEIEELRKLRNQRSEEVERLRIENPSARIAPDLIQEVNAIKEKLRSREPEIVTIEQQLETLLLNVPNLLDDSVPEGKNSQDNQVVRQEGRIGEFSFVPKPHWEIGENLDILDFAAAAKMSGTRFALLQGKGAALERALITFMLDVHIKNGYREVFTPYLVKRDAIQGTGQLPKFTAEVFRCADDDLYLIPTAEVSVTNIFRDRVIPRKDLPQKLVAYSACFRREAGSYGQDTRGLIRNHQFNKIELVKISSAENSNQELEKLLDDAERILRELGLTYRVVLLCSGDTGFAAAKTYDLEVWMPGEKRWREVSSCSNFKDFQARRLNIKVEKNGKKELAHTLNGSGLAVGRTFAAILENYQQADGSVAIPDVLRKYTGFDIIKTDN